MKKILFVLSLMLISTAFAEHLNATECLYLSNMIQEVQKKSEDSREILLSFRNDIKDSEDNKQEIELENEYYSKLSQRSLDLIDLFKKNNCDAYFKNVVSELNKRGITQPITRNPVAKKNSYTHNQ